MRNRTLLRLALCVALATHAVAQTAQAPRRRALLVGIDDYTASKLARISAAEPQDRDWSNLAGAVNDVETMRALLVELYGFTSNDIVVLPNQQATRSRILLELDQLAKSAAKGDILLFYYAGHGSQVRNTRSTEPDKKDESIVPADSRRGAADIRDKELRVIFNRILDRGARLTVILDNCHSASGGRGLPTGGRPRIVKLDTRDAADPSSAGPRPEDRGALIIAAAQDFDVAWETRDEEGNMHGAFSWAWANALRDAAANEPVIDTFLRAQARLRADTPTQEPVIAGNADVRFRPFLGTLRQPARRTIAIETVKPDGTVILQGGWAHGLTTGSVLRLGGKSGVRLEVTAMKGPGRCEARVTAATTRLVTPTILHSGALVEIAEWAAPDGLPLRIWMPRTSAPQEAVAFARQLAALAVQKKVRWIADPVDVSPRHVVRWGGKTWEHIGGDKGPALVQSASEAIARIPTGATLFLQMPAPAALAGALAAGRGIESAARPEDAGYILAGRFVSGRVEYAWVRPLVSTQDQQRSPMPLRTLWYAPKSNDDAAALRDALRRLRRIHGWQHLEAPPNSHAPYRLVIRRTSDGRVISDGTLTSSSDYGFVLRARAALPDQLAPRYVYAFMIDSRGKGVLLFPPSGSVENRFPLRGAKPPKEILLGDALFEISPPFGVDTYFLLTTDEPLPNPWILDFDGVRGADRSIASTPLEKLLADTGSTERSSSRLPTPPNWSIERVVVVSKPQPAVAAR